MTLEELVRFAEDVIRRKVSDKKKQQEVTQKILSDKDSHLRLMVAVQSRKLRTFR